MNEVINGLIDENFAADAVILGDGDYPTHPIPVGILQRAKFLCCCDGAGKHHISLGGMPDAIVGDGDSLPSSFKEQHRDIIHIFHEQDDNDLTKSTKYCIQRGAKTIIYLDHHISWRHRQARRPHAGQSVTDGEIHARVFRLSRARH
jgi:uncharacterized Rossmann fold enzyme